jgi:histidinol-phosphatase
MADWSQELAFAHELADRAALIGLEVFHREFEVRRKDDDSPVTEADTRIEAMLRDATAERYPGDAILGEEEGHQGSSDRVWIVDPIDGTKNFAAHIPIWATLIALSVDGQTRVGLASAPMLAERYSAARGRGATMNGHAIHVSRPRTWARLSWRSPASARGSSGPTATRSCGSARKPGACAASATSGVTCWWRVAPPTR